MRVAVEPQGPGAGPTTLGRVSKTARQYVRVGSLLAVWSVQLYGTVLAMVRPETNPMSQAFMHLLIVVAISAWLLSPSMERWVSGRD